jgi:hypothetical protein
MRHQHRTLLDGAFRTGKEGEKRTVLSMTSCARALSYISTVTPLRAVTLAESSERRELFWRSRS